MKFLTFVMCDSAKVAELAQASDKVQANPAPGSKTLAMYTCMGIPFAGAPPDSTVTVTIVDAESTEAMAANSYPLILAGASVWYVPVLEMPVGGAAQEEKKYRG